MKLFIFHQAKIIIVIIIKRACYSLFLTSVFQKCFTLMTAKGDKRSIDREYGGKVARKGGKIEVCDDSGTKVSLTVGG